VVVTQLLLFFGQTSAHRSSGTSNVLLLAILSTVLLMVLQSAVSNLKHIFNGHWHEDKFGQDFGQICLLQKKNDPKMTKSLM
jgi:hypothetical protein